MSVVGTTSQTSDVLAQYAIKADETKKGNELGKNEFLELMIAQLNNQNPLEPQDNGEFISQLAQFSGLEETQKLTRSFDSYASQYRSTQALQASALVGRSVVVPATSAPLTAGGEIAGFADLPSSTSDLKVSVYNNVGELVRTIKLGAHPGGQVEFAWDGRDESGNLLPPGKYTLAAEAKTTDGPEQVSTLVSANVDSVSISGTGNITLNLAGMGAMSLGEVRQIN